VSVPSRKRPPKLAPAPARGIAVVVERIECIEQWLSRGTHPRRAAKRAQKPPPEGLGLSRHTAQRYVAVALGRLMSDQAMEPIESKRARLIAMAHAGVESALSAERHYENKHGEHKSYPQPDHRAAATYLDLLVRLELRA
jgi:hypothetical protein